VDGAVLSVVWAWITKIQQATLPWSNEFKKKNTYYQEDVISSIFWQITCVKYVSAGFIYL